MKKLHSIIITIAVLLIGSYAQAESSSSSATEVKQVNQTDLKEAQNQKQQNPKIGFGFVGLRSEFTPLDQFSYYTSVTSFRYGHYISSNSFFSAGIDLDFGLDGFPLIFNLKYGYDLIQIGRASLGTDVSLLLGVEKRGRNGNKASLAVGFALGAYIQTFVSRSAALILRVGATHDTTEGFENFDLKDTRMYMGVSMKWHFY